MSVIPEDIIFSISRYGQVLPGLTPEYILTEVNNATRGTGRPINWASELMIEYLRRRDPLYNRLKHILEAITKFVDEPGVNLVVWDEQTNQPKRNRLISGTIPVFDGNELKHLRSDMLDVRLTTDPRTMRAIQVPRGVVDHRDIEGINHYMDDQWIVIPVGPQITRDDLNRVLYLTRPRSNIIPRSRSDFVYSRNTRTPDYSDYPWIVGSASRSNIPGYEGRELSDIDLIRLTLTLNPQYNLGSLLSWIEVREDVCSLISRSPIALLQQAIEDSQVITISTSGGSFSDIVIITEGINNQPIVDYMNSIGVSLGERAMGAVLQSDGLDQSIIDSIRQQSRLIEMCLLDYKDTVNNIGYT